MSTTRVITAFTTRGKKEKITTDVATWGELKPLLKNAGIEVDKLLATENQNKSDLVNDAAVLPTVDFVIFFRPKETKSGSLSYKETRNAIKEAIEKYGDHAKEHFNKVKNYTTKSASELTELLASYVAPSNDAVEQEPATANVADVVESVAESKAQEGEEKAVVKMTAKGGLEIIKNILDEISSNTSSTNVVEAVEIAKEEIEAVEAQIEEDFDLEGFTLGEAVSAEAVSEGPTKEEIDAYNKKKAEEEEAAAKKKQEEEEKAARKKAEEEEDKALQAEMKSLGII